MFDPLSIVIHLNLGSRYLYAGDLEAAERSYRSALELDSEFYLTHLFLARWALASDQLEEAVDEITRADRLGSGDPLVSAFRVYILARSGNEADARQVLAALRQLAEERYVPAHVFVIAYSGLGEKDEMFRQLARAVEDKSSLVPYMSMEPMAAAYRADPRMTEVIALVQRRPMSPVN